MPPVLFSIARAVGGILPPVVAHKVTLALYPYRRGRRDHYEFRVRSRTGSVLLGETSEYHAHHFGLHGYFDWKLLAVARSVSPSGGSIVEVGANIGTETIGFADIVGRSGQVLAFEPLPSNVAVLRKVLAVTGQAHVRLEACAVADRAGELSFVAPTDEGMTGVGHLATEHEAAAATAGADMIRVPVVTLDDFLGELRRVSLLAIDVEGAEPKVLEGGGRLIERDQPAIVIEAQADLLDRSGSSLPALAAQLRGMGYDITRIGRIGLETADESRTARPTNWFCWPVSQPGLRASVDRRIKRCGLLPPLSPLNPLCS